MATAEELLRQAAESGVAATETKSYLTVDLYSRIISVPSYIKNLGVESDDEVNRLYFKIPRFYNNIDLSEFIFRINYTNANGDGDIYSINDVEVDGDNLIFSWLVGRFAFVKPGNVNFIVCMLKTDEFGVIDREFNTTICSLPVLKGLETVEYINEDEKDLLQSIAKETAREVAVSDEQIEESVKKYMLENPVEVDVPKNMSDLTQDLTSLNIGGISLKSTNTGEDNETLNIGAPEIIMSSTHFSIISSGTTIKGVNDPHENSDAVNKQYVDTLVGDIDAVLDELHNYAQALIAGGVSE